MQSFDYAQDIRASNPCFAQQESLMEGTMCNIPTSLPDTVRWLIAIENTNPLELINQSTENGE